MAEINHIALAKAFGARISQVRRPSFGFFSALRTVDLATSLQAEEREKVDPAEDPLIVQAFEETREGFAADVLLADPPLKNRFLKRCRELGVLASRKAISRRLIAYRKTKSLGVTLQDYTKDSDAEPRPYLHAAEFAYVQTRYRFGVSIDDLLTDDEAAHFFVELAQKITPGGRPLDYITAALYIRKTRNFKAADVEILRRIESASVDPRFKTIATLDRLNTNDIPEREGLFLFAEKTPKERPLFIGSDLNLRAGVLPFVDLAPFRVVANHFWTPKPENIVLRVATVHDFEGVPTRSWALKLIHDRSPLYNVPVQLKAA